MRWDVKWFDKGYRGWWPRLVLNPARGGAWLAGVAKRAGGPFVALVLALSLAGCGGGGSGSDGGEVVIGLTDAPGDFVTYQVDVTSLILVRADGTRVETLPAATRVDFAEYTELTEFLTAATVPLGVYKEAILRLDYTGAVVEVEVVDDTTNAVLTRPAELVDPDGNPLTQMDVAVHLEGGKPLKVKPGLPAHLVLDFDLAASNDVDLTDPNAPRVTVEPFLLAEVNPVIHDTHRLRGILTKVNVEANLFHVRIHPFRQRTHAFGTFPVKTGAETVFEIGDMQYVGDAGLVALARLYETGTRVPVVAFGKVNRAHRHMRASLVRAGSAVPWGDRDAVQGAVIARTGDILTVSGAALSFADGRELFYDQVTVQVGEGTRVTRADAEPGTLDHLDISVGQRITALGKFLPVVAATDSQTQLLHPDIYPPPYVLDATEGVVRLNLSSLSGKVLEIGPGTLVVDLRALNGRSIGIYDFTGTGAPPDMGGSDADPAAYMIDTGALALGFLSVGDPVHVRGHVTRFGTAPPDFTARTVVEPVLTADMDGVLKVEWEPPTAVPFLHSSADGVVLNLDGSPRLHHLFQRVGTTDLTLLAQAPAVVPPPDGTGRFAIRLDDSLHIYFTFSGFEAALTDLLAKDGHVGKLVAEGTWDSATATLTAKSVAVRMFGVILPAEDPTPL